MYCERNFTLKHLLQHHCGLRTNYYRWVNNQYIYYSQGVCSDFKFFYSYKYTGVAHARLLCYFINNRASFEYVQKYLTRLLIPPKEKRTLDINYFSRNYVCDICGKLIKLNKGNRLLAFQIVTCN